MNSDGKQDLVGSFTIHEAGNDGQVRSLFLILESEAATYQTVLTLYHRGRGERFQTEKFIDIINLDVQGTVGIVSRVNGWEGFGFRVYRKIDGRWKNVYDGGGCAI